MHSFLMASDGIKKRNIVDQVNNDISLLLLFWWLNYLVGLNLMIVT